MMPAALRRKLESPNAKAGKAAVGAHVDLPLEAQAQSIANVANVAPAPVPDVKSAAPQRPPPRPADAASVPQLNAYVRAQLPKGEVVDFVL